MKVNGFDSQSNYCMIPFEYRRIFHFKHKPYTSSYDKLIRICHTWDHSNRSWSFDVLADFGPRCAGRFVLHIWMPFRSNSPRSELSYFVSGLHQALLYLLAIHHWLGMWHWYLIHKTSQVRQFRASAHFLRNWWLRMSIHSGSSSASVTHMNMLRIVYILWDCSFWISKVLSFQIPNDYFAVQFVLLVVVTTLGLLSSPDRSSVQLFSN